MIVTKNQVEKSIDREIELRESVYEKQVAGNKMRQVDAEYQLATMKAARFLVSKFVPDGCSVDLEKIAKDEAQYVCNQSSMFDLSL